MAWFSLIKNLDFTRLEKEVNEIKDMLEDYVSERDSAMVKLDYLLNTIGQKILDGELYEDKDIRQIAEDMQRKPSSEFKRIGELEMIMDEILINEKLEADEE